MRSNNLKTIRTAKGLSGHKVAELIGISSQYYYDLEKGDKRLNEDVIISLTEILGVSSDEILGIKLAEGYSSIDAEYPEVAKVLRRAEKPTERERKRIAKIIELIIEDTEE